mgnify:CR=1 FL=1|tara:strand:- start:13116 stop:14099 length:984 start_codon:yes stop_codon:yes gene_type:complete
MKDSIIIYVSSYNNYDMLEEVVLKNINTEGFEFINVDDNSFPEELEKGKSICKKHGIQCLENKSTGVQMATQTVIDFINKNRPKCKWIICFQHDNWPLSKDFFTTLNNMIINGPINDYGCIGFNVLDNGKNTRINSVEKFKKDLLPRGMLGHRHLSYLSPKHRWISPTHNDNMSKHYHESHQNKYAFIIDIPTWAVTGWNIEKWNKIIEPTTDFNFLFWAPDLIMQFAKNNIPTLSITSLYIENCQSIKKKYNIPVNLTHAIKKNSKKYSQENYGEHHKNWIKRWGWDFENPAKTFPKVKNQYKNTLINKLWKHNCSSDAPYKIIEL